MHHPRKTRRKTPIDDPCCFAPPQAGFRALELRRTDGGAPALVASSRIASAPDGYTDQELNVRVDVNSVQILELVGVQTSGGAAVLSILGARATPRFQATWVPSN